MTSYRELGSHDLSHRFEAYLEADGDQPVVRLRGEVDLGAVELLERVLADCDGEAALCVDLADVHFLDWPALHALLRAHERRQADGGTLTLATPTGAVRRLLDLAAISGDLPSTVRIAATARDGHVAGDGAHRPRGADFRSP